MRIDTHNHLLPGVDDGCRDASEVLANARLFVAHGYTRLFCTPHFGETGFNDLTVAQVAQRVAQLRQVIAEAQIPLELRPGGEIRLDAELPETLRTLGIPTFGHNTRYVLVDTFEPGWPTWATRAVEWLHKQGLTVILAHPERMEVLQHDPAFVDELLRMGLLLQGTWGPLAGVDRPAANALAERFLKDGRYFLIGSDAHRPNTIAARAKGLAQARAYAGDTVVDRLTIANPETLWVDETSTSTSDAPSVQRR